MVLLDTNALLWLVEDRPQLGVASREMLASRHPVYYSAVSVQELVIKQMKGRLVVPDDLCARLDAGGLRQLPLAGEHAEALREFPSLAGHDPFDRALLAQAQVEGLVFLTSDRVLLSLEIPWIRDARA
ncbi:MAG: type II toxin-antitoxin system VapC family toxin [Aeromicrobium sp.]|uniref:type II toxin-antitoxin system VapC family toxin n=1 Tax=Aeromicrobium sp. TaxID=1871063 RepID=UPI0039E277FE